MFLSMLMFVPWTLHCAGASDWKKTSYPNPMYDFGPCNSDGPSYVCHTSTAVSKWEADELRSITKDIENSGSNRPCGKYRVAIAIVDSVLDSAGNKSSDTDKQIDLLQEFADYLQEVKWDFGDTCYNDIVIVLATSYYMAWTSPDRDALKVLSWTCVNNVYSEFVEYFKKGSWADGLIHMVKQYRNILNGYRTCEEINDNYNGDEGSGDKSSKWRWWQILLVALAACGGATLLFVLCQKCGICNCKCGGGGGGGSSLHWSPVFDWGFDGGDD